MVQFLSGFFLCPYKMMNIPFSYFRSFDRLNIERCVVPHGCNVAGIGDFNASARSNLAITHDIARNILQALNLKFSDTSNFVYC